MWFALPKNEWKQQVVVHSIALLYAAKQACSDIGRHQHNQYGSDIGRLRHWYARTLLWLGHLYGWNIGMAPTLVWLRHWYGSDKGMQSSIIPPFHGSNPIVQSSRISEDCKAKSGHV